MNATFLVCVPAQGAREPMRRAEHETLRVGRTRDGNDVSLPGDVNLGSHHCEFFFRDDAWHVRDLETESGTSVDGERIQETVLVNGSRVRVGIAEIVYTPDAETQKGVIEEDSSFPLRARPVATEMSPASEQDDSQMKIRAVALEEEALPSKLRPPTVPGGSGRRAKVREIE